MSIEEKKKIAEDIIAEMKRRINLNKEITEDWGKTVQQVFTDIETGYLIKFAQDGTVGEIEKKPASEIIQKPAAELKAGDAVATIYCTVQTLKDCFDGKLNAMDAMAKNLFKIEGSMDALIKLSPVLM